MAYISSQEAVDLPKIFKSIEMRYPERWRPDGWYLTATATLIASGQPALVAELYLYLISSPKYAIPTSRQRLVRRMREAMVKCIILVGIPAVMEAFIELGKVERPEDQDHSFSRQGWKADEENYRQGQETLNVLYRGEHRQIYDTFSAHKDIPWISDNVSYGLFLSDHKVIDIVESEMVILPAIMCQNLPKETAWHLRGCLRVGMTREEVEQIQQVIESTATSFGRTLDRVGRVSDIPDQN